MIGDRWGVTDKDVARHYPCDDIVRAPVLQAWRGVTVDASADELWPWIGQIRLAPYSYDWIDTSGVGRRLSCAGWRNPLPVNTSHVRVADRWGASSPAIRASS